MVRSHWRSALEGERIEELGHVRVVLHEFPVVVPPALHGRRVLAQVLGVRDLVRRVHDEPLALVGDVQVVPAPIPKPVTHGPLAVRALLRLLLLLVLVLVLVRLLLLLLVLELEL